MTTDTSRLGIDLPEVWAALDDALDAVADWGHAHAEHLRRARDADAPTAAARSGG